jgi:tetratricopeptide (TPR) repeat protein
MRYLLIITALFFTVSCTKEDPEGQYLQAMSSAQQYLDQDKFDEARIELQNALEAKPDSSDAHFKLAQILVRKGNLPRAVENYTSAINFDPENREARVHLASIMVAARQFEMAESHISKLLEKNPNDTEALILKANIEGMGPRKNSDKALQILNEIQLREPDNVVVIASRATYELSKDNEEKAEELFRKALSLAPDNSAVKMALADLFTRQGRLDEAQGYIENVVEQNPDSTSLRYMLGEFLLRRGLGEQAVVQYQQTLASDPENLQARDRLYDYYLTRKETEKAKALTDSLSQQAPDAAGVKYFEGRNLELDGKTDEALAKYLESLKLLANFAPLYRRVGAIELNKGQVGPAIEHLAQGLSLDQNDVAARYILARAYFLKGEMPQASQQLDTILSRFPKHLGANILRADVAVIEDEPERAEEVYSYLVKAFPKNPVGFFKKAVLEEKKGNIENAISWYRKTIDFDEAILPPARRLVALLGKQGTPVGGIIEELKALKEKSKTSKPEFDLMIGTLTMANPKQENNLEIAKKFLHQAIEGNPQLVGAYFALGAIDAIGGDLEAAAQNYERLLNKDEQHIPTLMLLALTRERQSKIDEAVAVYKRILGISPRFAPAANNLAWLLVEEVKGADLEEALSYAELAKEEIPTDPSIADTLGWVHVKKGNPELGISYLNQAIDAYRKANPDKPVNPEMYYHLATALSKTGEQAKAKALIDRAIKAAGDKHPKAAEMKELASTL